MNYATIKKEIGCYRDSNVFTARRNGGVHHSIETPYYLSFTKEIDKNIIKKIILKLKKTSFGFHLKQVSIGSYTIRVNLCHCKCRDHEDHYCFVGMDRDYILDILSELNFIPISETFFYRP